MNQNDAFSPPLVVKLIDDRKVKFALSLMDHWIEMAEEIRADRLPVLLEEIDRIPADQISPVGRALAKADARDAIVDITVPMERCRREPKWIKRHLTGALIDGGTPETDVPGILALIPPMDQATIADQIRAMPVFKGNAGGTDESPLVVGLDLAALEKEAKAREASRPADDSIGAESILSSQNDAPASVSEASRIATSQS